MTTEHAPRSITGTLAGMYDSMLDRLGPSGWWPGETPFEVAVGAILTQNTNWKNVAKAIAALKEEGLLEPQTLHETPEEELSEHIRPAGYFRLKASRLKNFLYFLQEECGLDMTQLGGREQAEARRLLLGVNGIGPETADSILLYALDMPVFVVDAYTRRILSRHGICEDTATYDDMQALFMDSLPPDAAMFNEFHALLVRVGSRFCRKSAPLCKECPLGPMPEQTCEDLP